MELFDAVDRHGNQLGFEIVRGQKNPEGIYHKVAQVFTFNQDNLLLITLRHPDKVFGSLWEVTAGSVIKGESETQGAVRELEEETGIVISENDLKLIYTIIENDSIWYTYMVKTTVNEAEIRYQEGETVNHRWIDAKTFMSLVSEGSFPYPMIERMKANWDNLKQTLKELVDFDII